MKKYRYGSFVLLVFGLFYFSEGKPCPERTRPHKSRCNAYYKCIEVTADKHVWVPSRCEEGLIYEHSLAVCVLPADDWECLMGDRLTNTNQNQKNKQDQTNPTGNKDADIYIVANADDEENSLNTKYDDDGKVDIIIGTGISDEDRDELGEELYDGSGNGGELVEMDGFMPAQNREADAEDLSELKQEEEVDKNKIYKKDVQKLEQKEELKEMLQAITTKAEIGEPSTNIDPKLTAHLQRLSQLVDGLKQTYQTPESQQQDSQSLRPDELNAILAHFNINNKFNNFDPNESSSGVDNSSATAKLNRTLHYMNEFGTKLSPETKVVLTNMLPKRYGSNDHDSSNSGGGNLNSQIVVNRPEGAVVFSLPAEHSFLEHSEYSSENTPKISEQTLKTVLELSKQMIFQQNVPKVVPNPTYFGSPIMQPILLTPHVDSPFSTNYISQSSNGLGFASQFNNGVYNKNYKYKRPGNRPQNNGFSGNNNGYGSSINSGYSNEKPSTTIIHNNVMPLHFSNTNSGDKEVLESYGQISSLYPPHHEDRPDSNTDYHDNSNGYSSVHQNNKYSGSTTKRPSFMGISTSSSSYGTTPSPFNYKPTSESINQYFTPSDHLGDHNINNVFPSVDSFGSIPRPMKGKRPNLQMYKPSHNNMNIETSYGSQNQIFPQTGSNKVHLHPNSQNYESMENDNYDVLPSYQDYNNEEEAAHTITYTYGNKKQPGQSLQFSSYGDSSPQSSVFSTNYPYMPRPQTNNHNSVSSTNSYFSPGKNKYSSISSPISSSYADGTQLVNVGGNFISFDVFQNSILPLVGNNPASLSASLNNVEVITCATGVRQPNATDCTRYYVCSKKDGKVLSYSCPPCTAFNSDSRICDAKTYAICSPDGMTSTYTIFNNKRIQTETLKALQEAKRRQMLQQQQAIKAQNIANLLQQYNTSPSTSSVNNALMSITSPGEDSSEQNMLSTYMQQASSMSQTYDTTARPHQTTSTNKKRKYYCKEGDKIADQTSIYNYFVCYKNAQGQMKGHKMTCSKGLLFCPKSTMCTLPSKCS